MVGTYPRSGAAASAAPPHNKGQPRTRRSRRSPAPMLSARGASCRSAPRLEVRRLHSAPRTPVAPRAVPTPNIANRCTLAALQPRQTRTEVSAHARLPLMRAARSSGIGLFPRQLRCAYATEASSPSPAPEGKPASQPEVKPAEQQAKPAAAAEGAPVLKAQATTDESSSKEKEGSPKSDAVDAKAAPAAPASSSRIVQFLSENRGVIWMVLFINFIIWLNSFMLGTVFNVECHLTLLDAPRRHR